MIEQLSSFLCKSIPILKVLANHVRQHIISKNLKVHLILLLIIAWALQLYEINSFASLIETKKYFLF